MELSPGPRVLITGAWRGIGRAVIHALAARHPSLVRPLGSAHGLSPRLADLALRRVRGVTAAPRR